MKRKHKFLLSLLALTLVIGSLMDCGKGRDGKDSQGSKQTESGGSAASNDSGYKGTASEERSMENGEDGKYDSLSAENEVKEEVREQSSYKLFPMELDEIDVYAKKKKPAKRKFNLDWDHKLFYRIEGVKLGGKLIREDNGKKALTLKDFKIRRKVMKNKATGNRMEYEIYTHTKTGKINKIVSIEYREKDLELTDYYYTNDGKPNVIFVRKDSIYTPRFADADIPGERYYFNKDVLLKWRWVDKPFDVKERALKSHRSEAKPQYLYQNSSKKEKKAFDKEEVKMLNAAYNTLAAMKKKSEHGRLHGYVIDRERKPVKGAKVEILENGRLVGELTTNEKGLYETGIMENKDGYDIKVSADGFGEVEVKGVKVKETDEVILVEVIILVKASDKDSKVSLNLFDAEKAKKKNKKYKRTPLKKAKVVVRKGMENRSGDIVLETVGNEKGKADFNLPNGIYTVEIIVDGYVTAYRSLVVEGDVKESLPLVKKPKKKGMKIVVNWEGDTDLDSTLFTPNEGIEGEVFYVGSGRKKEGKTKLILDGKKDYTTEVITIEDASKGNFKYYVSDYTRARKKDYASKDMKKLKLVVYVYDENGLVAVYTLPYDVKGIIWEVFEVKNGKVLPLQKTYSNVKGKSWWTSDKTVTKNEIAHREYEKLLREIMRNPSKQSNSLNSDNLSFAYHDIDKDGVDEVIIRMLWEVGIYLSGREVIYTYRNGKVQKVIENENNWRVFGVPSLTVFFDLNSILNYMYDYEEFPPTTYLDFYTMYENGVMKKDRFIGNSDNKDYRIIKNNQTSYVNKYTFEEEVRKSQSKYIVNLIPMTDSNIKKHRKTYNSEEFKKYFLITIDNADWFYQSHYRGERSA